MYTQSFLVVVLSAVTHAAPVPKTDDVPNVGFTGPLGSISWGLNGINYKPPFSWLSPFSNNFMRPKPWGWSATDLLDNDYHLGLGGAYVVPGFAKGGYGGGGYKPPFQPAPYTPSPIYVPPAQAPSPVYVPVYITVASVPPSAATAATTIIVQSATSPTAVPLIPDAVSAPVQQVTVPVPEAASPVAPPPVAVTLVAVAQPPAVEVAAAPLSAPLPVPVPALTSQDGPAAYSSPPTQPGPGTLSLGDGMPPVYVPSYYKPSRVTTVEN